MEISSLNTNNLALSNVFNIKALQKTIVDTETLEISSSDNQKNYSDFSIALQNNINIIMLSQESLQKIDTEIKIVDDLHNTMLQSKQVDDEKSSEQYKYLLKNIVKKLEEVENETKSNNYFDGILGAKSLNPNDIMENFEEYKGVLFKQKEFFNNNIKEATKSSMELIDAEKAKVAINTPSKKIDYGASIQSFLGSIPTAQANGIPSHSEKLLA